MINFIQILRNDEYISSNILIINNVLNITKYVPVFKLREFKHFYDHINFVRSSYAAQDEKYLIEYGIDAVLDVNCTNLNVDYSRIYSSRMFHKELNRYSRFTFLNKTFKFRSGENMVIISVINNSIFLLKEVGEFDHFIAIPILVHIIPKHELIKLIILMSRGDDKPADIVLNLLTEVHVNANAKSLLPSSTFNYVKNILTNYFKFNKIRYIEDFNYLFTNDKFKTVNEIETLKNSIITEIKNEANL